LLDEGARLHIPIKQRRQRKGGSWDALTAEEQKQMNEVVKKLIRAANQRPCHSIFYCHSTASGEAPSTYTHKP